MKESIPSIFGWESMKSGYWRFNTSVSSMTGPAFLGPIGIGDSYRTEIQAIEGLKLL